MLNKLRLNPREPVEQYEQKFNVIHKACGKTMLESKVLRSCVVVSARRRIDLDDQRAVYLVSA